MNTTHDDLRALVRDQYGQAARAAEGTCQPACCGPNPVASGALGYSAAELALLPEGANMGLGCGNPQAIAALRPGETVLDLGSGGGIDCFLAARQVGATGRVIGVDMTPDMVSKARAGAVKAAVTNVDFRLGEIERLPVADASVDAIISNCVINLSPDKAAVFREAARVLRPGGRLAISDVVALVPLPLALKDAALAYTGCVAGAETASDLKQWLAQAGFDDVRITPKPESSTFIAEWFPGSGAENFVASATIEATKPSTNAACCAPGCCP